MNKDLISTHEGELTIGSNVLPVAVLKDGTRVITQSAIFKAFGRTKRGRKKGEIRVLNMPAFIDANNLQPFISKELHSVLNILEYQTISGVKSTGYRAEILPLLCDVYLEARVSKKPDGKPVLTASQQPLAQSAEILMRSLSKVGIIALVDEATGYEKVKEKDALQEFLQKFILEQKGIYVSTYPPEFFEAIFKMKNWTWKQASTKKPSVVGHYINNYVYSRLAPQVLAELRKKAPAIIGEDGKRKSYRKSKFTEWIDPEYGHPKLKEHLIILTAFAKASGYNWTNWQRLVERALPQYNQDGSQDQELPFND